MVPAVRMVSSLVMVALVGAPALACPPGKACIARTALPTGAEVPAARAFHAARPIRWAPRLDAPAPVLRSLVFVSPPPRRAARPEMWKGVRERLYAQMPHVKQSGRYSMVLSPLAVRGTSHTVPGFGVVGSF